MERREKTEFLLEQMRVLILVAKGKDEEDLKEKKEDLSRGEADWIKVRVGGRKVNEGFLKEKGNEVRHSSPLRLQIVILFAQDLKLKYYDLMIQYALHNRDYLDAAKHYHKIWETPSVKDDTAEKGREVCTLLGSETVVLTTLHQALSHVVYYVVLAPHDNEQSDMLHRVSKYPELVKLESQ